MPAGGVACGLARGETGHTIAVNMGRTQFPVPHRGVMEAQA